VKADAALVGADGRTHLDAVAPIDLDLAGIVHPGHAEHDGPFRLDDALQQAQAAVAGIFLEEGPQGFQDLLHGLEKLRLLRVPELQAGKKGIQGVVHGVLSEDEKNAGNYAPIWCT